jgi:hypothetical protein
MLLEKNAPLAVAVLGASHDLNDNIIERLSKSKIKTRNVIVTTSKLYKILEREK